MTSLVKTTKRSTKSTKTTNDPSTNLVIELKPAAAAAAAAAEDDKRKRPPPKKDNKMAADRIINDHVILHLKCSLEDLHKFYFEKRRLNLSNDQWTYSPEVPDVGLAHHEIKPYDTDAMQSHMYNPAPVEPPTAAAAAAEETAGEWATKLKKLKIALYHNTTLPPDKKADCFWCCHSFDNTPCYIPKYEINETLYGYGSFCCPECAVAFLMREGIDESTKFDRYHLLNKIYTPVYNYTHNIRAAPDPHYILDKFYGTLSIDEYRQLIKTPQQQLVFIEKPMTRVFPELHDDLTTTTAKTGIYKVKRESERDKQISTKEILKTKFAASFAATAHGCTAAAAVETL
jgi:hypothetical protein